MTPTQSNFSFLIYFIFFVLNNVIYYTLNVHLPLLKLSNVANHILYLKYDEIKFNSMDYCLPLFTFGNRMIVLVNL